MAASVVQRGSDIRTESSLLRGNQMPMWIYDRQTLRVVEVSEGALRQYGYTREEFLALTPQRLLAAKTARKSAFPEVAKNGHSGRTEVHRHADGTSFPVRVHSNALIYNGRVSRLVVASPSPIPPEPARTLPHTRDSWTMGLTDRSLLEHRAAEALAHADRRRRRVAVVSMDIDHFDEVAERYGDAACDTCLERVAYWLHRRVRGMDTVARTGVHGFTIVLAELDDHFDIYRVAEALLKIFAEPVKVGDESVILTASVGIAVYPDDARELERLQHAADTAMHQARASGGHRIAMFSLASKERTELAAYMQNALKAGSFRLHYQPQYSPAGTVCKFEALLRLPRKEGGFIPPDLFIPVAEETGMIEELGMWVIEEAACQLKMWKDQLGGTIPIAVNVSPLQLKSAGFAKAALERIRGCGADPACIEFEITERAVLNFTEAQEPMQELARAGIVFAVDDFGTGYSSLQHLHRLPISVLKIDRYFINRLGVQRDAGAIVEAIVSMAHALGMKVVAEGVETQEQRDTATFMGCDVIQGFLHSAAIEAQYVPLLLGWPEVSL
ncbi:EAL domain-containing protein [Granulicella aggregans]|uniref:EAL domain-containing protein n=1 Tax=Granulicella aggregans TaxID=474949 RepID=UPI0021E0EA47|nr:EAL domain-containing protein [Granulicella aggregans]